MQTFLPYPSFTKSAQVLDRQRLGKQRVEVLQILRTLSGDNSGWRNHPAVRLWAGYANELVVYGQAVCEEWLARGYKDTCLEKIAAYHRHCEPAGAPPWLGDEAFHSAHRAALLAKDPAWYGRFGWTEAARVEYVWPGREA